MKRTSPAFTIVELLIVIVVIGILAALVMSTFASVQSRARDTKRSDDIAAIKKALELYKADKGTYPVATANPDNGGWELSTDVAGSFMEYLKPYMGEVPLDPLNTSTNSYWYYRYPPGQYGCPVENGGFYVLRASAYEDAANKPKGNGVNCPSGSQNDPGLGGKLYLYSLFENP